MSKPAKRLKNEHKQNSNSNSYTSFGTQSPLSARLRTTLTYASKQTNITLSSIDYQFRLNSLFDPDFTGGGHQPKGFDQLAALYQRYRVYRARWEVSWSIVSSGFYPTFVGAVATNENTGFTDITDFAETAHSQWMLVGNSYPLKTGKFRGVVDLAKLNGKTHAAYAADDTTQALITANPTEILNLHVMQQTLDNSTALAGYSVVQIWYDVEFSDPFALGQS